MPKMGEKDGQTRKEHEHTTLKYATNHSDCWDASFALIASNSDTLADNLR